MNDAWIARRVRLHGRVQGVWFRGWTEREARSRGLDGWVRNRRDGTVEAVFAGPKSAVRLMIDACHTGPPAAKVRMVEESSGNDPGAGFHVLPAH